MDTRIMTKAYEARNLSGFEGDTIMADRIRELIRFHNINLVIEGGTYLGGTARRLAMMCQEVITIENNLAHYEKAKELLSSCKNTYLFFGSTVDVLPKMLHFYSDRNILFFSDAHWEEHNPMLEELEIIYKSGLKPVIAIHDFKVPDHPELGYDIYKGIVYEWDWIKPSIEKIYGKDYRIEYNSKATGAMRGIIYIMPL